MTRSARTILERWGVTRFLKDSADRRQRGINRLNVADAVQHCSFPDSNGVERGSVSIPRLLMHMERKLRILGHRRPPRIQLVLSGGFSHFGRTFGRLSSPCFGK